MNKIVLEILIIASIAFLLVATYYVKNKKGFI